jgi:hypothetical protein
MAQWPFNRVGGLLLGLCSDSTIVQTDRIKEGFDKRKINFKASAYHKPGINESEVSTHVLRCANMYYGAMAN